MQLWSVQTGELLRTLHSQTPWVGALAFSQDGQFLALANDHKVLQLWCVESGALIYTLDGHMARVTTVAFSPDGTTLVSGSWDNTIGTWEVTSGALRLQLALLPNNEWLASHPEKRVYNTSLRGDTRRCAFWAALCPVYPLSQYRKELKRTDLLEALQAPQPAIQPK